MKRLHLEQLESNGFPRDEKRAHLPDNYMKALNNEKFELRLLIPSSCCGAVIGKRGENVQLIREKYNAFIGIVNKSTPESVLTMCVPMDYLVDSVTDFLRLVKNFSDLKSKHDGLHIRMIIHESLSGGIIGRNGDKIKELHHATGARLTVSAENLPKSSDRVLHIEAPLDRLPMTVKQIVDILEGLTVIGSVIPYDPFNYAPQIAYRCGSFQFDNNALPSRDVQFSQSTGQQLSGAFAQSKQGIPAQFSRDQRVPPSMPTSSNPVQTATNQSRPQQTLAEFGDLLLRTYISNCREKTPDDVHKQIVENTNVQLTCEMVIPTLLVGSIIGHEGKTINRIRQESGAKITIEKPVPGRNEQTITIVGNLEQTKLAYFELSDLIRSTEEGRRFLLQQQCPTS